MADDADKQQRAERYAAWAERLHRKRADAKESIVGGDDEDGLDPRWAADQVYLESDRVARRELSRTRDPFVIAELLRTLGLEWSASTDDIESAYKQLAKVHHPDFHHDADEGTRRYHAERMQRVNDAYEALQGLDDHTGGSSRGRVR